jgi:hypothetical protein
MNPYQQLWQAIQDKAQELGLIFVDGPNPTAINPNGYVPSQPNAYSSNGQERAGFSFSVTR